MEDKQIVELYWQRSDTAIAETQRKYGAYCRRIASNILPAWEDVQECVNDTYLAAWNAMPPHRPNVLSSFLGKLTRRISINRWKYLNAEKRGGSTVTVALDELSQCIPGGIEPVASVEVKELAAVITRFLEQLPVTERRAFLMRYFELAEHKDIERSLSVSGSQLRSMLHRTRKKLRLFLQKEGFV